MTQRERRRLETEPRTAPTGAQRATPVPAGTGVLPMSLRPSLEPQAAVNEGQTQEAPTLETLAARLAALVPEGMRPAAETNIPLILRQCLQSDLRNANQVAYILATARHEARFGTPQYSRSEALVEDHNPLRTEHRRITREVNGRRVTETRDEPYRINHVTGHRIAGDDLNTYYDDAYGGRLGNVTGTSDAADFRGRGFVQLTGRDNYRNMSQQLTEAGFQYTVDGVTYGTPEHPIDLVANPTHVNRVPELASRIMISGMSTGSFTGRGLGAYITDDNADFFNARSTVNGDKNKTEPGNAQTNGEIIAGYARDFAAVLNENNAWTGLFAPAAPTTTPTPAPR